VIYTYLGHEEQKSTGLIVAVLIGLTSVVVYVGLVMIGFENDWQLGGSNISYVDDGGENSRVAFVIQQSGTAEKISPAVQQGPAYRTAY
jgi:hypothetical protein